MKYNEKTILEGEKILKILGNKTRLRILLLLEENPLTVNQIVDELKLSQPAISKQLSLLREYQLVSFLKRGKESLYSLEDFHILNVIEETLTHSKHVLE